MPDFSAFAVNPDGSKIQPKKQPFWSKYCGIKLPYSWLLCAVIALFAAILLWPRSESKQEQVVESKPTIPPSNSARQGAFWVAKWQALASVACVALLISIEKPGFNIRSGHAIGEAVGAALFIFVLGLLVASITAWFVGPTRANRYELPLVWGVLTAMALTAFAWAAG